MGIRRRQPRHVKVSVVVSADEYALLERTAIKRRAPVSIVVRELILRWFAEQSNCTSDPPNHTREKN